MSSIWTHLGGVGWFRGDSWLSSGWLFIIDVNLLDFYDLYSSASESLICWRGPEDSQGLTWGPQPSK